MLLLRSAQRAREKKIIYPKLMYSCRAYLVRAQGRTRKHQTKINIRCNNSSPSANDRRVMYIIMRLAASLPPINKQTSIRTSNTARIMYEIRSIFVFSFFILYRHSISIFEVFLSDDWSTHKHPDFGYFLRTIFTWCVLDDWIRLFIYSLTFRSLFLVVQKLIETLYTLWWLCKQTNDVSYTNSCPVIEKRNFSILFLLKNVHSWIMDCDSALISISSKR